MWPRLRPAQKAAPVSPVRRNGLSGTRREVKVCSPCRPPLLPRLLRGMPPAARLPQPQGGKPGATGGDGAPLGVPPKPCRGLGSDGGGSAAVLWHRCAHRDVLAGLGLHRATPVTTFSGALAERLAVRSHNAARFIAAGDARYICAMARRAARRIRAPSGFVLR